MSVRIDEDLRHDICDGLTKSSMAIRLTRHLLSLIGWENAIEDPIRKQFLPLKSEYLFPHPQLASDSLAERQSEVYPGIIHRYPNKILFLLGTVCPSYCAFCTRSYAVGPRTQSMEKAYISSAGRIRVLIDYLIKNPNIRDVVISGGDIASVAPSKINSILNELAQLEFLKTIRLATRTLLFDPNKFSQDSHLFDIITSQSHKLKKIGKELSIQCHFNHSSEVSELSKAASLSLSNAGVVIRNQTVLLEGVNSDAESQKQLIIELINAGIYPYYVYQMDMVPNAEHFRTSLATSIEVSRALTGFFPGFYSPKFVIDLPKGGGKRSVYEYDSFDQRLGVYVFRSPLISKNTHYYYCDPLRYLDSQVQSEWREKKTIQNMYSKV
jgi:lysine 2,3-aminomutase